MPTKTKAPKKEVTVKVTLIPYYGITFDHPTLSGVTATGRVPRDAITNARAAVAHLLPHEDYVVTVEEENPDTFERAGAHFDY